MQMDQTENESTLFAPGTFNNGDTGGDSSFLVRRPNIRRMRRMKGAPPPPPKPVFKKKNYTTIKGKCWGVFENLMIYEKELDTEEYCFDIEAEEDIEI